MNRMLAATPCRACAVRKVVSRSLSAVALLGAALTLAPAASAATISWDGDTSVTWATGANWVGGTAPASSLTTDTANFNLPAYGGPVYAPNGGGNSIAGITIGANNGAMTVAGNLSIGGGGIVIANGAGQLTLSGTITPNGYTWLNHSGNPLIATTAFALASSLRLGGAGGFTINSVSSANLTILANAGAVSVTYANFSNTGGTWANNSAGTVTVGTSGINGSNNNNTFTGSGNWLVTGNLTGTGSFTKTGFGTLTLQGAANTHTGTIPVSGGGQFVLNGDGALTGSTANLITANTATLVLDNSTTVVANRIHDSRTLNLGNFTLTGKSGSSITETVAGTTFGTTGTVTINNGSGSDVTTLALGTVTRSAGAAISFVGSNGTFGTGPKVTSTASWGGASNGVLPWGTVNRTSWAADSSGNLVAYGGSFVDPTSASSDATANARLTGSGSMNEAKSFNSLNVISDGSGQSFDLSTAGVLTLTSGGILKSGSNAYEIKGTATDAITSGTELIAHVDGGDLTISAKLKSTIVSIAKGGSGKLVLSGTRAATFNGAISVDGTLEFQGANTTLSPDITGLGALVGNLTSGQTLILSGSPKSFTGGLFVQGGNVKTRDGGSNKATYYSPITMAGGTLQIENHLTIPGLQGSSGTVTATASYSLTLATDTATSYEYSSLITNGSGLSLVKAGAGTQTLSGTANTYAGATTIQDGTLTVTKLANFSSNSSIGAPASGDIKIGNAGDTGTLRYTGSGDTANRTIQIGVGTVAGDCGGATIQNDGSGALVFSAATFNTAQSGVISILPRTLTLQGSSTAANAISGIIQNNTAGATGTGAVALTKAGVGSWLLSGANTYTGDTRVNAGTLALGSGGSLGNTAVTVADGATLSNAVASATSIGGSLTLESGAKLGLTADAIGVGRVAVTGALVLNGNTLTVHVTGTPLVGGNYIVAPFGSRSGTFNATPVFTGLGLDAGVSGASLVYDDDAKTVTLALAADARRPEIENRTSTPVSFFSATLKGYLSSTGTAPTTVWAAWDTNDHPDASTELPTDWEGSAKLTPDPMTSEGVELSHPISSLSHNKTYYYSFFASNSVGTVWALPVTNLVTLNAGPTLTGGSVSGLSKYGATIAATLSSTGAAVTTVWAVWDTNDHPSATAPTGWPFNSNLLTKSVGTVSNILTGLTADTPYYYRFYASNTYGTAWLTPSPTFTTLNDRIVDWQGNYVSGSQNFRATFSTSPTMDTDGGGTANDYAIYAAFDDVGTPLSPSANYSGLSATFYGGARFDWFNQGAADGNSVRQVVENTTTDRITTRTTKGNSATSAAIVWIQKDFLIDGSGKKVSFDADSVLSVNLAEAISTTVRFLVRDGDQYFISQTSRTSAGLLTLSNPNAANWTAYTPAGGAYAANLRFNAAGVTWAPHTFTNIRAVGYHVGQLNASNDSGARIDRFQVTAVRSTWTIEIANGTASADVPNRATFHGTLSSTGTAATAVWVAWDANPERTEADPLSAWAEKHPFGTMTSMTSNLTYTAMGLPANTTYYYRFFASNIVEGEVGAAGISNVTTLASDRAPKVSNLTATPVSFFSATLKGYLDSTGTAPTTVWAAWDTNAHPDVESEVPSDWMGYAKLSPDPMEGEGIEVSHPVTSLNYSTKYYYSFFASNSVGTSWALPVTNFTTLFAGPVIANTAATREDMSGAQINANLSSTGAAATTVWAVWDTTDHPAATLPTDWPAWTNLGPKGVGAVSNLLTGLSEYTEYTYRFYASNLYEQVWGQPSLTFRTLRNFIVDWDGDYVTANADLSSSRLTFNDSGTTGLQGVYIPFNDSTIPLNPASGYDLVRRSARFYGGVMMDRAGPALPTGNFLGYVMEAAAADGIRMQCTKSNDTRVFGAVVWLRADFRNVVPANARMIFKSDSVMRAEVAARGGNSQIRFLVRDGDQYYVSQTNRASVGTFTLSNPGAANWAPYNPSGRDIIANLSGFAPHEFMEIKAVGYYVHTTGVGSDPEIRVSNFEVKAHPGEPYGTLLMMR